MSKETGIFGISISSTPETTGASKGRTEDPLQMAMIEPGIGGRRNRRRLRLRVFSAPPIKTDSHSF